MKDKENNRFPLYREYSLEYFISYSCESNGAVVHRKIRPTNQHRFDATPRRSRLVPSRLILKPMELLVQRDRISIMSISVLILTEALIILSIFNIKAK